MNIAQTESTPGDVQMRKKKLYVIGDNLHVYMTPRQAAKWNAGEFVGNAEDLTCLLPVSGPDRSYVRDGEVIYRPGLPDSWEGTIRQAIREGLLSKDVYESCMWGEEAIISDTEE